MQLPQEQHIHPTWPFQRLSEEHRPIPPPQSVSLQWPLVGTFLDLSALHTLHLVSSTEILGNNLPLNSPFNHRNSSIDLNYWEGNAFDWLCASRVSAPSIAKRHFWKLQIPNFVKASACPSNHCMYSVAASWTSQNALICLAQHSHWCCSYLCCCTHAGNALWKRSHLYKITFKN